MTESKAQQSDPVNASSIFPAPEFYLRERITAISPWQFLSRFCITKSLERPCIFYFMILSQMVISVTRRNTSNSSRLPQPTPRSWLSNQIHDDDNFSWYLGGLVDPLWKPGGVPGERINNNDDNKDNINSNIVVKITTIILVATRRSTTRWKRRWRGGSTDWGPSIQRRWCKPPDEKKTQTLLGLFYCI